jgi:uncharacterized protein YkwD
MPNYLPGNIVDAELIGENGRPVEGYTFASIQSLQTEDLAIGEGFNALALAMDEWLYTYEGMTTLEMAVFNRINEVRAEHNLHPLIHDPMLSVGARYRTAYFQRVLPRDVRIDSHDVGTIRTRIVQTFFNPIGGDGGAILNPAGSIESTLSYGVFAHRRVNGWLNSPAHRDVMLNPSISRIGVGITPVRPGSSSVASYVFFGAN